MILMNRILIILRINIENEIRFYYIFEILEIIPYLASSDKNITFKEPECMALMLLYWFLKLE